MSGLIATFGLTLILDLTFGIVAGGVLAAAFGKLKALRPDLEYRRGYRLAARPDRRYLHRR